MRALPADRTRTRIRLVLASLAAVLTVAGMLGVAACGSSDGDAGQASPAPVKSEITKWMPKDASSEPPWNGRFVQVNVRVPDPGKMDPGDWRVFVNDKEPELEKAPSILPFSPSEATVAFVFSAPYGDLGTYEFRVVYAPKGGQKVQRSWEYKW
jgi:hypothetical protein